MQTYLEINERVGLLLAFPRSSKWAKVAKRWLDTHGTCAACGWKKDLQVHHKKPYHLFPELELSLDNLITLCEYAPHNCHFIFGHLLNWKAYNEDVVDDVAAFLEKIRSRPTARGFAPLIERQKINQKSIDALHK